MAACLSAVNFCPQLVIARRGLNYQRTSTSIARTTRTAIRYEDAGHGDEFHRFLFFFSSELALPLIII